MSVVIVAVMIVFVTVTIVAVMAVVFVVVVTVVIMIPDFVLAGFLSRLSRLATCGRLADGAAIAGTVPTRTGVCGHQAH